MPRRQPSTRTSGCNNSASSSSTAFSSLPLEVHDALRQLPSVTERLAEGAADDAASPIARLGRAERRAVQQHLTSLLEEHERSHGFSAEAAAALLSKPVQLALLHLALASLRVTPGELREGETRDCGGVQAFALTLIHTLLHQAEREGSLPQAATFIRALLRAQALQAASRQLAALAEVLLAVPAAVAGTHQENGQGQEQQDGEQQQQQQGRESGKDTVFVKDVIISLRYVALFVYDLVHWAAVLEDALCMELAAALHDSGVLEHAARALLLLPLVGRSGGLSDVCLRAVAFALTMCTIAHEDAAGPLLGRLETSALPGAAAAASQLRDALSGRCVQTAALSVGLATLCAADGGSAYGLPPEMLAALPAKARIGAGGPRQEGLPQVRTTALGAALHSLALESRAQPPGRRGALSLALRVGRLGVASAVAAATAGADAPVAGRGGSVSSNSSGSGGGTHVHLQQQRQGGCATPRMVVAADASASLCCTALWVSALLLQQAPPGSPHWRADAEDWCRLACAAVRHTLRYAWEEEQRQLCDFLAWAADEEFWTEEGQPLCLPPEPPAVIAAALGGGLLPCLERLMRRAGQAPQGPEAALLRRLLGTDDSTPWPYLAPLLAYGDPRQAAALVATLGKLLRAIDPSAALATAWEPDSDTQHLVVWVTGKALLGVFSLTSDMATLPQEGGSAPVQQLARLMSLAACEWLPALSRLVQSAMQAALKRRKVQRVLSELPRLSLSALLLWLPLLAVQGAAQGTAAPAAEAAGGTGAAGGVGAATGAPGPTAGGAPEGEGRASWRALVLGEVGAVPLLGTALELAAAVAAVDKWQGPEGEEHPLRHCGVLQLLVCSCAAVADMLATPGGRLAADLAAATGVPPDRGSGEASSGAGQGPADCGEGAALPWQPEHLRAVAARLRGSGGEEAADAAEGLADALEGRHEGGDVEAALGSAVAATDRPWRPDVNRFLKDALVPPSEARRLLRTCGNPGCTNLAGDSEVELPLLACSRCGAVGYCCRACQVAHWRAGHGAACKGGKKGQEGEG